MDTNYGFYEASKVASRHFIPSFLLAMLAINYSSFLMVSVCSLPSLPSCHLGYTGPFVPGLSVSV